jgi:hypothetical protein
MPSEGIVEFDELQRLFELILPAAAEADIVTQEFRGYFEELRRRLGKGRRGLFRRSRRGQRGVE